MLSQDLEGFRNRSSTSRSRERKGLLSTEEVGAGVLVLAALLGCFLSPVIVEIVHSQSGHYSLDANAIECYCRLTPC